MPNIPLSPSLLRICSSLLFPKRRHRSLENTFTELFYPHVISSSFSFPPHPCFLMSEPPCHTSFMIDDLKISKENYQPFLASKLYYLKIIIASMAAPPRCISIITQLFNLHSAQFQIGTCPWSFSRMALFP